MCKTRVPERLAPMLLQRPLEPDFNVDNEPYNGSLTLMVKLINQCKFLFLLWLVKHIFVQMFVYIRFEEDGLDSSPV